MVRSASRPTPRRPQRPPSHASQPSRDVVLSQIPRSPSNRLQTIGVGPMPKSSRSPAPTPLKSRSLRSTLKAMPDRMPIPVWLRALKKVENLSVLVAFSLVGSAVLTYGWAVYSQQLWGKNYSRLDTLRRDERQLLKGSEVMKNNIARHNDPKQYGLVPRNSDYTVVIPPAPLRAPIAPRHIGPEFQAKPIMPIGY